MLTKCIAKLMRAEDLTADEVRLALSAILADDVSKEQIAAFLVLLHAKGETAVELQALVSEMRARMTRVTVDFPVLDVVGTGGDGANTVNISTASSLLAAACGAKVVKHGNRSVSSRCGSADLLAALGVPFDRQPSQVIADIKRCGFAFCFAPNFHPAMGALKSIRKALAVPTTFNLMGPLLNPANAQHLLLGVFDPSYLKLLGETLLNLGVVHAMVVHSCGLDELSLLGAAEIVELRQGKMQRRTLDPKKLGFDYYPLSAIQGGDVEHNKKLISQALSGETGPIADTILLNTGVALYVADVVTTIEQGIALARDNINTGGALQVLNNA